MNQRLQFWIDLIDQTMRSRHPNALAPVPRPKAFVIDSKNVNAFQGAVSVCYENPIALPKSAANASAAPAISISADLTNSFHLDPRMTQTGFIPLEKFDARSCISRTLKTLDEAQSFVQWFNSNYSSCKLKATPGTTGNLPQLSISPSCANLGKGPKYSSAQRLMITASSNWIMALTGLIKDYTDEEQMVSILAHEMGHYYRAHMVAPASDYQYYYRQSTVMPGNDTRPKRPVDPVDAKLLSDTGTFIAKTAAGFRGYAKPDPVEHYHPAVFDSIVNAIEAIDESQACAPNSDCSKACSAALADLGTHDNNGYFQTTFPHSPASGDTLSKLKTFEAAVRTCAQNVPVIDGMSQPGKGLGSFETLQAITTASRVVSQFGDLPRDTKGNLTVKTLDDALEFYNDFTKNADAQLQQNYQKSEQLTLGMYSFEQEADEVGNEILSLIGIPTSKAVDAVLTLAALLEAKSGHPYPPALSSQECTALRENDWKDSFGKPVFIHMGDFVDPHHTGCYRAFHFFEETKLHGLIDKASPPPQAPGDAWANVIKSITK